MRESKKGQHNCAFAMETPAVSGLKLKITAISMLKLGLILFLLNKRYIAHCVDESVVLAFVLAHLTSKE